MIAEAGVKLKQRSGNAKRKLLFFYFGDFYGCSGRSMMSQENVALA
jgi:hypothetical protein